MPRIDGDAFFEKFRVKPNHFADAAPDDLDISTCMYETFGEELEFVSAQDPRHVWTLIDEDGTDRVLSGFHHINRIGYLVTELPWTDADTVVELD